jgi:hypothetical protein
MELSGWWAAISYTAGRTAATRLAPACRRALAFRLLQCRLLH